MPLTTWYDWLLSYFYDVGYLLLFITAALLAYRRRSALALVAAIGFASFIVGIEVQKKTQRTIVEAQQTKSDYSSALVVEYAGFVASTGGFLIGTASLFAFVLRRTRPGNDKRQAL